MLRPWREFRFSLRARATSWYVGLLAVALLVFSAAIYLGIRTYLKMSLQRALSSTAQTLTGDYLSKLAAKGDAWVLGEVRESYDDTPTDRYIRLSTGGRAIYQTNDMREPSVPVGRIPLPGTSATIGARPPLIGDLTIPRLAEGSSFHRVTVDGQAILIYVQPFSAASGRVIDVEVGASLYSMQQTLLSLARVLLIATVVILVLAAIGGYFLMKQPLRPLAVLTAKAANIGRTGLGERLPVPQTGDELERLTQSLNGMIDRLEEALNHNHRFSADASHELRTPLTIMRGELEEMLRTEGLPQQAVENIVSTLEELDRMSRIVNSLMIITRLDAGGERMAIETVDLSGLVKNTVEHMRLLAEEKGLPLTCACEDGVYVDVDPMRIKQVLVNLIDNAIKYTQEREIAEGSDEYEPLPAIPEGGEIMVSLAAVGRKAVLRIADCGIGISPEALPRVFDRFYRADLSRSRGAGGVGLGLAIVKAIVTAHEGLVSITSDLGKGSTVTVELPLAKLPAAAAREQLNATQRQPRYQGDLKPV